MISEPPPAMFPTVERDLQPRLEADGFIPDELMESLVEYGQVHLHRCIVTLRDGRRFITQPAVRVLGPRLGTVSDPLGLTGSVSTVVDFLQQGFAVSPQRVTLGRLAYDVEHGVLAFPLGTADDSGVNVALPS